MRRQFKLNLMNRLFTLLSIVMLILTGCVSDTREEAHEQGLEPLVYTIYSDKTELFVEFKPLVVGGVSKFATHLTLLGERFAALKEGEVTLSLVVGEKGIRQVADTPSSPGIFRLELKPISAGTGKLIFDIKTKDYIDQFVIDKVIVYADEKAAIADEKTGNGSGGISYLKEQAWATEFSTKLVEEEEFADIIKSSGQILSAVGDEVIVTAGARGVILFNGQQTLTGANINASEKLFSITGGQLSESNVEVNYKDAKTNFDKAKADFERHSELVKSKIISEREFLQSKSEWEKAEVRFQTLSKNYSAKGQSVTSPITGYIKNIVVTEGQFVEMGTPLATISKNKKLLLQANVSPKYYEKLGQISSANFKIVNREEVFSTLKLKGKLLAYGKSASERSPFIPVTFEFENSSDLIPGSVAEVFLQSSKIKNALVVPVSSLIEEQGIFYVYVQTGGESFEKREVKLGASDGIKVQLLTGVKSGERVVDKGAFQIKLSVASGAMPAHGHEH